jgi:hypothetical protein
MVIADGERIHSRRRAWINSTGGWVGDDNTIGSGRALENEQCQGEGKNQGKNDLFLHLIPPHKTDLLQMMTLKKGSLSLQVDHQGRDL